MNKIKISLAVIMVIVLMACTNSTNPLSSDVEEENGNNYDNAILFDTSGQPDNG